MRTLVVCEFSVGVLEDEAETVIGNLAEVRRAQMRYVFIPV